MSDMTGDTVFDATRTPVSDGAWALAHPAWARIGHLLNWAASYCGTHSAGYVTPHKIDRR